MELNSLFTIDDLRNVESFLREVDSLDEAIIIKDNRPMYRVIRIGSPCDRWVEEKRNTRGNLWKAMSEFLETCENQTAHAKDIAYAINAERSYITRSGAPVSAIQIRSRAQAKPEFFKCSKGNIIQLLKKY